MGRSLRLGLTGLLLATAVAAGHTNDAPADQYFGPQKMSAIEVRTRIDKAARNFDQRWQDDAGIFHDAQLVQQSLEAWAKAYPNDSWLAPTAFHLAQLYQKLHVDAARSAALAEYKFVAQNFPKTSQAHASRVRLQQGLPPLADETPVSPTPNPYAAASAAPSPPATTQTATQPSAPPPSAAPSATPEPMPSPTRR